MKERCSFLTHNEPRIISIPLPELRERDQKWESWEYQFNQWYLSLKGNDQYKVSINKYSIKRLKANQIPRKNKTSRT